MIRYCLRYSWDGSHNLLGVYMSLKYAHRRPENVRYNLTRYKKFCNHCYYFHDPQCNNVFTLHNICKYGKIESAKRLIYRGAYPYGYTHADPLIPCINNRDWRMLHMLIGKGKGLNIPLDNCQYTRCLLCEACVPHIGYYIEKDSRNVDRQYYVDIPINIRADLKFIRYILQFSGIDPAKHPQCISEAKRETRQVIIYGGDGGYHIGAPASLKRRRHVLRLLNKYTSRPII